MSEILDEIENQISAMVQFNELSNEDLVHIIEHCGMYLNLKTIPQYAKDNEMSYNGVKRFRKIVSIFDVKFVIDNE